MSLSLGGPAVMDFRRGSLQRSLFLPPRSLLVLAGESRYAWCALLVEDRLAEMEVLIGGTDLSWQQPSFWCPHSAPARSQPCYELTVLVPGPRTRRRRASCLRRTAR